MSELVEEERAVRGKDREELVRGISESTRGGLDSEIDNEAFRGSKSTRNTDHSYSFRNAAFKS